MGPYKLTLADPAWLFRNWSADAPGMIHDRARGAAKHYPCMALDHICSMRPPAAADAILLIWTISSHIEDTFAVIDAWGFTFKTKAWTWIKTDKRGRPRMGGGYWTRHCTEDCLLATRGKVRKPDYRSELDVIFAPRSKQHSGKPVEQYAKIDRLFPNVWPRLEMNARVAQPGWDVWGNECENSIIIEPSPVQQRMAI